MSSKADEKLWLAVYLDSVECIHTHDWVYDKFTLVGTSQAGGTKGELRESNQKIATPIIETWRGETYPFENSDNSLLFMDWVKPDDFVAITLSAQDIDFVSEETWKKTYLPLLQGLADLTKDVTDKVPVKKPEDPPGDPDGGGKGEGPAERVGDLNLKVDGEFLKTVVGILVKDVPDLVGKLIALDKPDLIGSWEGGKRGDGRWMTAKDWRDLAKENNGRHQMHFEGESFWQGKWEYYVNYIVETRSAENFRRMLA